MSAKSMECFTYLCCMGCDHWEIRVSRNREKLFRAKRYGMLDTFFVQGYFCIRKNTRRFWKEKRHTGTAARVLRTWALPDVAPSALVVPKALARTASSPHTRVKCAQQTGQDVHSARLMWKSMYVVWNHMESAPVTHMPPPTGPSATLFRITERLLVRVKICLFIERPFTSVQGWQPSSKQPCNDRYSAAQKKTSHFL